MEEKYKNITSMDVPELIQIHKESFDNHHFSVHFNDELLKKYFHFLINNLSFKIKMVSNENQVVGYLFAYYANELNIKKFIKKNFSEVLHILFKNPIFFLEKIYQIFRKKKEPEGFYIYLFAIKDSLKRKRYGSALIKYFEEYLLSRNIREYYLVVRRNNRIAYNFYIQNGLIKNSENIHSVCLKKELIR